MEDLSLQFLNYGVLGVFSILMLSALAVMFKLFKDLFNEYRLRLEDCNTTFKETLKDMKCDIKEIKEKVK